MKAIVFLGDGFEECEALIVVDILRRAGLPVQLVSIYLFGMLAASIYRIGVLLYGKPPKPAEIIKLLRGQHKQKKSVSME